MTSPFHQRIHVSIAVVLCALAVVAFPKPTLHADESPRIRATATPAGEAYVGQHVRVDVDVLTAETIFGSPNIDLPEIEGGVLLQASTQAIRSPVTIDGKDLQQTRYSFAFFPHRPGSIEIPPIRLRFSPETGITKPLTSPPLQVEATMPEGAENLSTLVSTTDFEARESWNPEPGEAKVGDAFVRTITMKAESVLGMGFPPLPIGNIDGLGTYVGDPMVKDSSNRGDFSGERTETITYVCEQEGQFEIPPLVIPWFDLSAKELKRVELEGRSLAVAPNPALERAKAEAAETSKSGTQRDLGWLVWFSVAAIAGIVAYVFRTQIQRGVAAWIKKRRESEPFAFRKLCRTAREGDAARTYQGLLSWANRNGHAGAKDLIDPASSPELKESIDKLSQFLFGKGAAAQKTPWSDGPQLAKLLIAERSRRSDSVSRPPSGSTNELRPLNP